MELRPASSEARRTLGVIYNPEAVVPPQCYTRIEGRYNPCYVCHQSYDDPRARIHARRHLQQAYNFSETGLTNHWTEPVRRPQRRRRGDPDAEIRAYVADENYYRSCSRA